MAHPEISCGGKQMRAIDDEAFGCLYRCDYCGREIIWSELDVERTQPVRLDHMPRTEQD